MAKQINHTYHRLPEGANENLFVGVAGVAFERHLRHHSFPTITDGLLGYFLLSLCDIGLRSPLMTCSSVCEPITDYSNNHMSLEEKLFHSVSTAQLVSSILIQLLGKCKPDSADIFC